MTGIDKEQEILRKMAIGSRLKEERERLGLTQSDFGALGGKGKTTVIAWEKGGAFPNADFLESAAAAGMDVVYVITGQRHENAATTSYELAFLRICRAFDSNDARQMGLNALAAMAKYNVVLEDESHQATPTTEQPGDLLGADKPHVGLTATPNKK